MLMFQQFNEYCFVAEEYIFEHFTSDKVCYFLFRDGTRKPVTEWKTCNLARVPSHVVMTNNEKDIATLWDFLNEAQV